MYIRLEVEHFMSDNNGSTLIESLFAFEIFITIIILFVGLFSILYEKENRIQISYESLIEKEGEYTYSQNFTDIIEMVLH